MRLIEDLSAYSAIVVWMRPESSYYANVNKGIQNLIECGFMREWRFYRSEKKVIFQVDDLDGDIVTFCFTAAIVDNSSNWLYNGVCDFYWRKCV